MTEDNRIPELWWSPGVREVWWRPDPTSVSAGILTLADEGTPFEALPDDAVQLVPDRSITDLEQELYNRAVTAESERDERQARIDTATAELKKWDALATRESEWMPCRAALAALVGDQPPRKPCEYVVSAWSGQEGSECIGTAEPGSDYCKPHGDALKALSVEALRDVEERADAAGDLP